MRIVITGASGQLGQSFFHWKDKFPEFTLVPCPRAEMDLSSEEAIRTYFAYNEFDLLINCAAYTHVDGAESNQVMAKQINVHGPSYLAAACVRKKIPILHFSSDYVYHNTLNRPLLETDPTHPESVYGRTKLAGEQEITRHTEEYQIFRSSWIIGPFGNNFLKSMIRLMQERDELKIVEDQIGTPTYSLDMAYDILMMIQNKKHKNYGVYNLSNSGVCSWFDLAMYIRHLGGYSCEVRPITTEEYPAEAERPYYSVMNKSKAKNQLGILLRPWQEAVEE
ncbi:MAG TPA: dTDP-4-dehydrorhamnose reductase, partial [Saprospiraceae bacterium]|nr:dTDP-4-dehydrorhamnose reductase [Saprospiraceae bacterium]